MSDPRLSSIARQCGLTPRELRRYVELQLIALPAEEVSDATLRRVRRIRRLSHDLDLDLEVVAIIVRLLDRIQELEAAHSTAPHLMVRVIEDDL